MLAKLRTNDYCSRHLKKFLETEVKLNKRYQKMVLVFSRVSVGIKLSGDAEEVPDLSFSSISP